MRDSVNVSICRLFGTPVIVVRRFSCRWFCLSELVISVVRNFPAGEFAFRSMLSVTGFSRAAIACGRFEPVACRWTGATVSTTS